MSEGKARVGSLELWWEDFGAVEDPAVLLIMGANAQATAWPEPFIQPLVEAGFRVVRFDNRDIGLSTWLPAGTEYTIAEMAGDTLGLLDALGIGRAHVVGASMGGMIAQQVVLDAPQRVLSLTPIMSSPTGPHDPELPGMTAEVQELTARMTEGSAEDPLDQMVALFLALSGERYRPPESALRTFFEADAARGLNPSCGHAAAVERSPSRREALRGVGVPTLVIHGDVDPILPLEHGRAIADAVPGAELLIMEGAGHELPLPLFSTIHERLLSLFRRADS